MPVIGIVKVGDAALADRYSYIPSVGIFIAVTFAALDLADGFRFPKKILRGCRRLISRGDVAGDGKAIELAGAAVNCSLATRSP